MRKVAHATLGVALCICFVTGCARRREANRKIVAHSVSRRGPNEYVLRFDIGEGTFRKGFAARFRFMKFASKDGRPIRTNLGTMFLVDGRIVGELKFSADIIDFPVGAKGLAMVNGVELPWEYVLTVPTDDAK